MTKTRALWLVVSLAALLAGARMAAAETSSWVGKVDGPAAPIDKKTPGAKAAPLKVIKTLPASPDAKAAPATPPPANTSAHAKTTGGDDAAYEAFDQGQYLTALELAVKAAERGEPQAHTLVARIYAEGLGASKNSPLAAKWYARGAELGDAEAMFAYGVMLAEGQGIDKDRAEAARLFEAAAARKHALANYNLALLFLRGAEYFRKAAEKGVATAQNRLARCYAHGAGVEKNAVEAAKWNIIAKAGGIEDEGLDKMAGQLSRADRTKAQAAAQQWHDRMLVGWSGRPA